MNFRIKYTETPSCKTCGQPMKSWAMMQTEFEHQKCASERMGKELAALAIKQLFEKNNNPLPPLSFESKMQIRLDKQRREVEHRFYWFEFLEKVKRERGTRRLLNK